MGMTLYEIDGTLQQMLDLMEEQMLVDLETGEILTEEEFNRKLDEVHMALSDKIENTMLYYKSLLGEIDNFKVEQKKLMERRKVKENLAERIKNRIDGYIRHQYTDDNGITNVAELNKWKMETPRLKLSYRKSDKVIIDDLSKIPSEYIKEHKITEDDVMKADIKKLLKTDKNVEGVKLVTDVNMQVK